MGQSVFQRSFGAGELAPALHARADTAKYTTGARRCRNFIVLKEGGVANRSGFRFTGEVKDSTVDSTFLFPFLGDEPDLSVLIEAGDDYLRFMQNGAPVEVTGVPAYNGATAYVPGDLVLSGGVNYYAIAATTGNAPPNAAYWYAMPAGNLYEIPHPFGPHRFNVSQAGHVLTLTHGEVGAFELVYEALTRWVLSEVSTVPTLLPPANLAWTPGTPGPSGGHTYAYVVTTARKETYEESEATAPEVAAGVGLPTDVLPNALTWDADPDAAEYYVYVDPYENGVFGYIGTATSNSFNDIGFVPDFTVTPPKARTPFTGAGNHPHVSATYQQRRLFAQTATVSDGIWGSRTGFPSNFGISSPLQDDDSLTFRIVGSGPVRWLIPLKQLVALADQGEWTIGEPKVPLTPDNIPTDQEVYVGSSDKPPVVIGNSIIYLQARGSVFRELRFDRAVEGWAGKDLSLYSSHLFKGKSFFRMAYQQVPDSILWTVRSDGTLLGLTYVPEEELWGWHRHDTDGIFEDCCVVPEGIEDALYVIVKRTIDGDTKRYIERLDARAIDDWDADVFFVDSGLSYSGTPANHISGLDHLEGKVVAVVGDGAVVFDGDPSAAAAATYTVTGGAITLPADFENVHVGLPIRYGELETLDLDVAGSAIRDKRKRVGAVSILIDSSARSFWAGPDEANLQRFRQEDFDPVGDSFSGLVSLNIPSTFNDTGRVLIRQTDPLPLTILGVLPLVDIGG